MREESIQAVSETLRSGWIGLGPKVKQFEDAFIEYLGNDQLYASAMNSATSALHIAVRLLNLKSGDHVATTSLTFVSTNHVLLYENLTPVFVDVQTTTGNLDPVALQKSLETNSKIKAIIVVHYSGYPCDMEKINALAEEYNIPVIEDCAHACGATYANGKKVGNSKNICCFSFQAVKNLPLGDGGMLVTSNINYKRQSDQLRWLGIDKDTYTRSHQVGEYLWKYEVPLLGFKYHMNDINATIGIEQLKYLDSDNQQRMEIARKYREELSSILIFMDRQHDGSACHFEPALFEHRDDLMRHLKEHNIHPGVHYRSNARYAIYAEATLPNTEYLEQRLITLPMHLHLTAEDISRIIEVIKQGW